MTINKERLQLGVDALRSDRFVQGAGRLTTINPDGTEADCCLGVLTKVAIENGLDIPIEHFHDNNDPSEVETVSYDSEAGVLPESVREWYGFKSENPALWGGTSLLTVASSQANDHSGWTFAQIADAFERTYITGDRS